MIRIFPLIQSNADRETLDHLNEIAGGVLRREQTHNSTRGTGHTFNIAAEFTSIRVDLDVDLLSRVHLAKLGFP